MKANYNDIISRIDEEPAWYDSNGVPRYGAFTPDQCPNIYATEVILLLIQCQECAKEFRVELHHQTIEKMLYNRPSYEYAIIHYLKSEIPPIHYGDPPSHRSEECGAGDTMNSEPIQILEFWKMNEKYDLERVPKYEVHLQSTN